MTSKQENDRLKLRLNADVAELEGLTAALRAFFDAHAIEAIMMTQVNLILEELFTNTITHGASKHCELQIEIELYLHDKTLQISYRDNGIPFNVLEASAPDLELPIEQRPIGGLGLHFVKAFTDSAQYQYIHQRNELNLTKILNR